MTKYNMENLSWKEVETYLSKRQDIVVPIGTVEQHGFHLPLSTDSIITVRLAEEVSRLTGILVAPLISYGVNTPADNVRSGSTGVSFDALRNYVYSILQDMERQGFNIFYLLTAHGDKSHLVALKEAGKKLALNKEVDVYLIYPYLARNVILQLAEDEDDVNHGGKVETSLLLCLKPEVVHLERKGGASSHGEEEEDEFLIFHGYGYRPKPSDSGAELEKSEDASAEWGKQIFDSMVNAVADFILKPKPSLHL